MSKVDELLSVAEVANKLKVTQQYVRKLISDEKLIATRVGAQWVVEPQNLKKYISQYDVTISTSACPFPPSVLPPGLVLFAQSPGCSAVPAACPQTPC